MAYVLAKNSQAVSMSIAFCPVHMKMYNVSIPVCFVLRKLQRQVCLLSCTKVLHSAPQLVVCWDWDLGLGTDAALPKLSFFLFF